MTKVNVGVIGVGGFGRHHARIYHELIACNLVGIYDSDQDRCSEVAQRHKTTAFSNLAELLDKVETVSIITPTVTHSEIALQTLNLGINTLIEKPIALDENQASQIIDAAERSGARLAVGHLERFNPAFRAGTKDFANLKLFRSQRLGTWVPSNLDVDIITDSMIHDLDLLNLLDDSPVETIQAIGAKVLTSKTDLINVVIKLQSGAVAILDASRVSAERKRTIRIFSDDQYVSMDLLNPAATKSTLLKEENNRQIVHRTLELEKLEPLQQEIASFISTLKEDNARLCSGAEARKALQMAIEIRKSLD